MDNANRNKVNFVLYIVLALIVVAVVCMTVFSIASNAKKQQGLPNVTGGAVTTKRPDSTQTKAPESTDKPMDTLPPEEDVFTDDNSPSQDVNAPVKMTYVEPVEGYLLKGYDIEMPVYSLTMEDYRVHSGLDILADLGAPVMAVAEGTVENIYVDPMMGNCISISHSDGLVSYYMGLSEEVCDGIEEGAPVYCGQVISSVGDSTLIEIAEESHLHFEMKKNGKYVDPSQYVSYEKTTSSNVVDDNYEG